MIPARHGPALAAAFATGLLLAAVGHAQVPPELAALEATEADAWPPARWVSFVDVPGDCDPVQARDGLCIEEAVFDPITSAGAANNAGDGVFDLRVKNTSELSHWLWEDIAWQLTESDTPASALLVGLGVTRPDALARTWDATPFTHEGGARVTFAALPERGGALSEADWTGAQGADSPAFEALRYLSAPGALVPPEMVVLSGRFASRLGYEGRRLTCGAGDCQVLDLGADTSGPFYEQLYPFRRERVGDANRTRPLVEFLASEDGGAPGVSLDEDALAELERVATAEFGDFARLVGSRVVEFGMADHTLNQMRVFTALTAMAYPPGELESATGMSRDLVAAALGQTDDQAEALGRVQDDPFTVQESFLLRVDQLPQAVVDAWTRDLLALSTLEPEWPGDGLWEALRQDLSRDFAELYRPGVASLPQVPRDLEDASLQAWLRPALRENAPVEAMARDVRARALARLVEALPSAEDMKLSALPAEERVQTWLLLDHLHQAFADTFSPVPGLVSTPDQVASAGQGQWAATLARHGISSVPIGQGLGAVDPLSICTTLDGRAALSEPAFGAIDVDLVLAARDGLVDAREVLWERRDELPFLAVDQPLAARPQLDRLVGLPEGRALYRVRWRLWSGWHLLWDRDVDEAGQARAVLRVAAFCDDMVLSTPLEVPTLVRAGLLHDTFSPTTPVFRSDLSKEERDGAPRGEGDPDAAVVAAVGVASGTRSSVSRVDRASLELQSGGEVDVPMGGRGLDRPPRYAERPPGESLAYVRSFVVPALERVSGGGPAVLLVFDHSDPGAQGDVYEPLPRVPYARVRRREPGAGQVHSAGWAMFLPGGGGSPAPLAPDFRPRVAQELEVALPKWERPRTLDWTLGLGLGHFPYRRIWTECVSDTASASVGSVSDCDRLAALSGLGEVSPAVAGDHQVVSMQQTEGFSADFQAMASWWIHDHPRLAGELGVETNLQALHPGQSWYWSPPEGSDPGLSLSTDYGWTFRFQTGPVVGLRMAPAPPALWRTVSTRRTRSPRLWGADQPNGNTVPYRLQWGVKAGVLLGPGYNGMEATALTELWAARALPLTRTSAGLVSPYRPLVLLGPYARVQYTDTRAAAPDRYLALAGSWTVVVGVRSYLRLGSEAPEPPELEVPE